MSPSLLPAGLRGASHSERLDIRSTLWGIENGYKAQRPILVSRRRLV